MLDLMTHTASRSIPTFLSETKKQDSAVELEKNALATLNFSKHPPVNAAKERETRHEALVCKELNLNSSKLYKIIFLFTPKTSQKGINVMDSNVCINSVLLKYQSRDGTTKD